MSEHCHHDCEHCKTCSFEKPNASTHVKKIIAIVSAKGGVGKSLVTGLLASQLQKEGHQTAILDADITGPSIPKMFGLTSRAQGNETGIFPAKTQTGISVMSLQLLLDHQTDPVLWRGPMIAGTVKQFWTEVLWGEQDYLLIDMPPGTGDVPLTVFQSIPVDGIVIVTSPQGLVSMIVEKAVNMAKQMNIPIMGLVENMSYVACKHCGEQTKIFGESHIEEIAQKYDLSVLKKIPLDSQLATACDNGKIEQLEGDWVSGIIPSIKA